MVILSCCTVIFVLLRRGGGFCDSYSKSFLTSPESTSYAHWIEEDGLASVLLYSNCIDSELIGVDRVLELRNYLPAGVGDRYTGQYCCGPRAILIDEIQALYFPEKDSRAECRQETLETVTAKPNITSNALRRREVAGDKDGIAISNGYTL